MSHSTKACILALALTVTARIPCVAQGVEPPFTWEGKGTASLVSEGGINKIEFQFELSVDEQGMFEGRTSNEDGTSRIKHVFYADEAHHEFGVFSRKVAIVLMINEYGNDPILSILNGRLLIDRFFYGEVLLARYEEGSDTARALGVGSPEATYMQDGELSWRVKSVLKECLPVGMVKIEGDYKDEDTSAATGSDSRATGARDGEAIALFNGRDLEGWYIYLEDADADPQNVWKVRDGEIRCTGVPTGFLRTRQEYSDFKLVLEWRWPEKPGNSGVLLRMSGEEKIWPLCMEAQLMHDRAGDFVGMGCTFNENKAKKDGPISYTPRMNDSNEKELGGWNTYEITCQGDTIEATINGQLQNRATGVTIRKGYIGLQSEGVPIMFRNITLTPLR